jgi:hypothetical protein
MGLTEARAHLVWELQARGPCTQRAGLADGHRELARHLFAGLPAEAFDGFEGGLRHVVNQLRALLTKPDA